MLSRGPCIAAIAVLSMLMPVVAGCGMKTTSRSSLGTTVGHRTVAASLDGSGSISTRGGTAVITFSGGKLIIDKESVQLDGNEVAKIPAEVKKVEVDYTAGALTVRADGASVFSAELRK